MEFTHINDQGRAVMVDVTEKAPTNRTATAEAAVLCAPETIEAIRSGGVKKGDVLAVAQVAGIQAAKHTWVRPAPINPCSPTISPLRTFMLT